VRDGDTDRARTLRSQVTDESDLELTSSLELVTSLSLGQALIEVLGAEPPRISTSMCLRIRVRERDRPLGFCNDYLEGFGPFADLSSALLMVDGFKFGKLTPVSVSVNAHVRRGVPEAFLLGARTRESVRAGERIPIRLSLRESRGPRYSESFTYEIPESTRPGDRVLKLRGIVPGSLLEGSEAGLLELFFEGFGGGGGGGAGPRSLDALAEAIAGFRRRDGLRATFARKGRGPVVLPTPRLLLRGSARVALRVTG